MASSSSLIVVITGASSQIGNRLTSMVASGSVFGKDQNIILKLLDDRSGQDKYSGKTQWKISVLKLTQNHVAAMSALEGLVMELCDCAFPRLKKIVQTSDPFIAFRVRELQISFHLDLTSSVDLFSGCRRCIFGWSVSARRGDDQDGPFEKKH